MENNKKTTMLDFDVKKIEKRLLEECPEIKDVEFKAKRMLTWSPLLRDVIEEWLNGKDIVDFEFHGITLQMIREAMRVDYFLQICTEMNYIIRHPEKVEDYKEHLNKMFADMDYLFFKNFWAIENDEKLFNELEFDLCISMIYYVIAVKPEEEQNLDEILKLLDSEMEFVKQTIVQFPLNHPTKTYYDRLYYLKDEEYNDIVESLKSKIKICKKEKNLKNAIIALSSDSDVINLASYIVGNTDSLDMENNEKTTMLDFDVKKIKKRLLEECPNMLDVEEEAERILTWSPLLRDVIEEWLNGKDIVDFEFHGITLQMIREAMRVDYFLPTCSQMNCIICYPEKIEWLKEHMNEMYADMDDVRFEE